TGRSPRMRATGKPSAPSASAPGRLPSRWCWAWSRSAGSGCISAREPSPDRTGCAQALNLGVVEAGLAQHFIAVLAELRRMPGRPLVAAVDPDRAVDGQHAVALERNQHV